MDVEMPDGTVLTGIPEGTPKDEILRRYETAANNPVQVGPQTSRFGAIGNAVGQGLSFGYADEAAAALAATVTSPFTDQSWRETYDQQVAKERANLEAGRQEYPFSNFAGEIGGAAITGKAAYDVAKQGAARAPAIAQWIQKAATRTPAWARLAGGGAAGGALYGSGAAVEGERLGGAAVGAGAGAVMAPVMGAAINVASRVGSRVLAPIVNWAKSTPRSQAVRNVTQMILSDDISPTEAIQRLNELGPEATIADLGPVTQAGARRVVAGIGRAKSIASHFLNDRQQGQQGRLLEQAFGDGPVDIANWRRGFAQWMNKRISSSDDLYEQAFSSGFNPDTPRMQSLLNNNVLFDQARKKAATLLQSDPGVRGSTMRYLHYTKMALDDMIGESLRNGHGTKAGILIRIKRTLLDEMDDQVPAYGRARQIFSDEKSVQDAAEMGTGIFAGRKDLDMIEMAVEEMTESEQYAFRLGALRGVIDKIESISERANTGQRLFDTRRARQVLRMVFPDDESFQRFAQQAEAESVFTQTRNTALHGARTYEALTDIESMKGFAEPMARGDAPGFFMKLMHHLFGGDVDERTMAETARILFSPQQSLRVTERINPRPPRLGPETSGAAAIGAGAVTGNALLD